MNPRGLWRTIPARLPEEAEVRGCSGATYPCGSDIVRSSIQLCIGGEVKSCQRLSRMRELPVGFLHVFLLLTCFCLRCFFGSYGWKWWVFLHPFFGMLCIIDTYFESTPVKNPSNFWLKSGCLFGTRYQVQEIWVGGLLGWVKIQCSSTIFQDFWTWWLIVSRC